MDDRTTTHVVRERGQPAYQPTQRSGAGGYYRQFTRAVNTGFNLLTEAASTAAASIAHATLPTVKTRPVPTPTQPAVAEGVGSAGREIILPEEPEDTRYIGDTSEDLLDTVYDAFAGFFSGMPLSPHRMIPVLKDNADARKILAHDFLQNLKYLGVVVATEYVVQAAADQFVDEEDKNSFKAWAVSLVQYAVVLPWLIRATTQSTVNAHSLNISLMANTKNPLGQPKCEHDLKLKLVPLLQGPVSNMLYVSGVSALGSYPIIQNTLWAYYYQRTLVGVHMCGEHRAAYQNDRFVAGMAYGFTPALLTLLLSRGIQMGTGLTSGMIDYLLTLKIYPFILVHAYGAQLDFPPRNNMGNTIATVMAFPTDWLAKKMIEDVKEAVKNPKRNNSNLTGATLFNFAKSYQRWIEMLLGIKIGSLQAFASKKEGFFLVDTLAPGLTAFFNEIKNLPEDPTIRLAFFAQSCAKLFGKKLDQDDILTVIRKAKQNGWLEENKINVLIKTILDAIEREAINHDVNLAELLRDADGVLIDAPAPQPPASPATGSPVALSRSRSPVGRRRNATAPASPADDAGDLDDDVVIPSPSSAMRTLPAAIIIQDNYGDGPTGVPSRPRRSSRRT